MTTVAFFLFAVAGSTVLSVAQAWAMAFTMGHWRRPPAGLLDLRLLERASRLFPIHLGLLIVVGAVDILILSIVFLRNIH